MKNSFYIKHKTLKALFIISGVLFGNSYSLATDKNNYPSKPIKMIVPFAAGGGADALGRELSQKMSEYLKVPVVVENLAGASTVIGTDRVAKSNPDGYTILLTSTTTFGTNPHLIKSMPFTLDDFKGISLLADNPLVLAAAKNTPFNSIKELVAYANKNNEKLSYGTQGRGATAHLVGEMIASELGIGMTDIPYKGSSPGLVDLVGRQIPLLVDGTVASLPMFKANRIKILAVTSADRLDAIPNIPTFVESGYPNMVSSFRFALFAPAKIENDISIKLNKAVKYAFSDKSFVDKFAVHGTILKASEPDETIKVFKAEHDIYGKLIKGLGLTLD